MGNIINLRPVLDVKYLYTASAQQIFEVILPFNQNLDIRRKWFVDFADLVSSKEHKISPSKIQNIFYGTSKLTSIERMFFEDIARKKLNSLPDPRQKTFYLRGSA